MTKLFELPAARRKIEDLLHYTGLKDRTIKKILNLTDVYVERLLSCIKSETFIKSVPAKKKDDFKDVDGKVIRANSFILADYGLDRRRKLTGAQVEEIKTEYDRGASIKQLAVDYGVSCTCILYHVSPDYKKSVNDISKARHALYFTAENDRDRNREFRQRKREIFEKIKTGEIQKIAEDKR